MLAHGRNHRRGRLSPRAPSHISRPTSVVPLFVKLVDQPVFVVPIPVPPVWRPRQRVIAPPSRDEPGARRCQDDDEVLGQHPVSHSSEDHNCQGRAAARHSYLDKTPDARPQAIVGQLPPPAGVRNGALVEDAADDVDQDGDEEDDGEDAARPHAARLVGLGAGAGVLRADLEEVGALVRVGADKGEGRRRVRVVVAEEGDGGGFVAEGLRLLLFFLLFLLLVLVFVVVLVLGAALGIVFLLLLVVVVVVVLVSRALVDTGALVLAGGAAWRSARVLEDELAPPREERAGLLAAVDRQYPESLSTRGGSTIP